MRALLLLAFLPVTAWADCASFSWNVFPTPGTTVPSNARFVLQGYGSAQPAVLTLATRKPRLVTEKGEQISLTVTEMNLGEFELTQAVLQPQAPLVEGTRYTLEFEAGAPRFALPLDQGASWIAGPADVARPRWTTAPVAQPGVVVRFGCGPQEEARVAVSVEDASAVQLLAR